MARGLISGFGTYAVDEADKSFVLKIERSSYPNRNGTDAKRAIQSLTAGELKFNVLARTAGGRNNYVWKRVK